MEEILEEKTIPIYQSSNNKTNLIQMFGINANIIKLNFDQAIFIKKIF